MKTSLACFTAQTNTDSILVRRDAITGIIDVDDPTRIINIYPNPFNKRIIINGLNPAKNYEIRITTLDGRQVYQKQVKSNTQANLLLNTYTSGTYWLTLYDQRSHRLIGTVQIIKQ